MLTGGVGNGKGTTAVFESLMHLKNSSDAARPRQGVARSAARPRNKPPRYVVILGFGGDTEWAVFYRTLTSQPQPSSLCGDFSYAP